MHAALISLVLMSGACGEVDAGITVSTPASRAAMYAPAMAEHIGENLVENGALEPGLIPHHGYPGCPGGQCSAGPAAIPLAYRDCLEHAPACLRTTPAWATPYHPAWYFYHRMLFHPANYAQPYAYRTQFDYPGNDPRIPCVSHAAHW